MNELKWIKFSLNMFDDEKIKIIESMPEGDSIIVIWCKLLTLTGKANHHGYIMLTDRVAYSEDMLTTILSRKPNVVKLALHTFQQLGMMEFDTESNAFYLPNWSKYQNVESMDRVKEQNRIRQQRYREKQNQLPQPQDSNVTNNVTDNVDVTSYNGSRKKKEERREKKDPSRQQFDYETDFNEFYQVYPKKVDKKAALRAYVKARKDKVEHVVIVKGAVGYANECSQSNTEKRYMKNPATWLNAGSYLDYQDDSNDTLDAANNTDYTQYKPLQKGWDFNARGNDSV